MSECNPDGLAVPTRVKLPARTFAVAATSNSRDIGMSPWAFGGNSRLTVIKQLRSLADFMEKEFTCDK